MSFQITLSDFQGRAPVLVASFFKLQFFVFDKISTDIPRSTVALPQLSFYYRYSHPRFNMVAVKREVLSAEL